MDHICINVKSKAKNNVKKSHLILIHKRVVFYLTVLICVTPLLWLPSLYSSMESLSLSLPNFVAFISNPKFLFILCNIIIVFLLRELKLYGLKSVSAIEVYNEYIKRNSSILSLPALEDITESKELKLLEYFPLIEENVKGVTEEVVREEAKEEDEERNSSISRLPTLEDINEREESKWEYYLLIEEDEKDMNEEVVREEVKEEKRGGQGRGEEEIMKREEDFHVMQECSVPNLICTLKYKVDRSNVILYNPINNVDVFDVNDIP